MSLIGLLLGWTHLPQWASELLMIAIACGAAVGGVALYNHHERDIGAQKCVAEVQATNTQVEIHNAAVEASDSEIIKQEATNYAAATTAPVLKPVRVYIHVAPPPDVPSPPAARPSADASPTDGGSDHGGPVPTQSFGPELQAIGHDADAQIAGLQDYISKVCLAR